MRKIKLFSIILNFLYGTSLLAITSNIPTTTVDIKFDLEVTDTIKVEPVYLDFGNILKNSNTLNTAQTYFNLSGAFQQDMLINTSYSDGVVEGEYTRVEIPRLNGISNDKLSVYLHNIKNRVLSSGEYRIPIVGEIREVGDIELGRYEKTIKMEVLAIPVLPSKIKE